MASFNMNWGRSMNIRQAAHRTDVAVLAIAVALVTAPASVLAQQTDASPAMPVSVAAQPLDTALTALADQVGIRILVSGDLTGRQAPALTGPVSIEAALTRLLQGSGHRWRYSAARTVQVEPAPAGDVSAPAPQGATRIGPVRVEGARGGLIPRAATDPDRAYRAERTTAGGKMDMTLAATPQSVSVVTADQIRDQSVQSVQEAVRYVVGANQLDYFTTQDEITLRGFGLTGTGLYRDGTRLIQNGFMTNLEPFGLERLEIVRGPASITFGQAAPGGLVNAVTKRPRADMTNTVEVTVGSFDRNQVNLDVGGALDASGQLTARLTAVVRDADTQWRFLSDDRIYVAPAIGWDDGRTRLQVLGQYQKDRRGFVTPYYRVTPFGPAAEDLNINGPGSYHKKESITASVILDHALNDQWTFHAMGRWSDAENDRRETRNFGLRADQRSINRIAWVRPDSEKTWTADARVEGGFSTGGIGHRVAIGVDHFGSDYEQPFFTVNNFGPLDLIAPNYGNPDWTNNFRSDYTLAGIQQTGFYAQDLIDFGSGLKLNLGGRYDRAVVDTYNEGRPTAAAQYTTLTRKRRDNAFTGRAGLIYEAANGLAPYVSWSSSFQPPIGTVTGLDAEGQPFEPEKGRQWEAGVRYTPVGSEVTFTAVVFDLVQYNLRTPSPNNPALTIQTGKQRSRGVELEARGEITRNLSVIANYAYLDAEILRSNTPFATGARPFSAPPHTASLWGKYRVEDVTLGTLSLGAGLRYTAQHPGSLPTQVRAATATTPALVVVPQNEEYLLADALVSWDVSRFRIALNVNNLFDKRFTTQCAYARGGAEFCALGYARDARLSVGYHW